MMITMMHLFLPLLACALMMTQAVAQKPRPRVSLETGGERTLYVTYKKVGPKELKFDVYHPLQKPLQTPLNTPLKTPLNKDAVQPCPVIVYTHGGGWAAGSRFGAARGSFAPLFKRMVAEGFAVVSVDYRLTKKDGPVRMRDCVIDSKDAVRFLVKEHARFGIDPERVLVFGDSAGGHIAQMLLLSPPDDLVGDPKLAKVEYQVLAGLSWYGPCDFQDTSLFNHDDRPDFRDRFGARITGPEPAPDEKQRLYREMSPVTYLKADSPPLLLIQGDQDTTIPVKHARFMAKKATAIGAPVETLIVQNAGHNWRKVGADIEPSREAIIEASAAFFLRHAARHSK